MGLQPRVHVPVVREQVGSLHTLEDDGDKELSARSARLGIKGVLYTMELGTLVLIWTLEVVCMV